MSIVETVARVQQLQSALGTLQQPSAGAGTGGDAFAALLGAVQGAATSFAGGGLGAASASGASATASTGSTGSAAPADGSGVTGQQIVGDAEKYLGVPYVFGGESTSGMDCSGLVQTVLGDLGISAPRLVSGQAQLGTAVPSLAQAQPGDLIVEKGNGHIQIYAGDGKIIEAPKPGENVVKRAEWLSPAQIGTIRRVATAGQGTSTSASTDASAVQSAPDASALMAAVSALGLTALAAPASASGGAGTGAGTADSASDGASAVTDAATSLAASLLSPAALSAPSDGAQSALAAASAAAPASAPAQPTAPLPSPSLSGQLSGPIAQLVQGPDGSHTVVVRVVPEQLGPVTVDAHLTEHGLRIELSAPSEAGRAALGGILGELRRDLAVGGLDASVSLGSAASGQGGQSGQGSQSGQGGPGAWLGTGAGDGLGAGASAGDAQQSSPRSHGEQPGEPGAPRRTAQQASVTAPALTGAESVLDVLA